MKSGHYRTSLSELGTRPVSSQVGFFFLLSFAALGSVSSVLVCPNETYQLSFARLLPENSEPPFPHLRDHGADSMAIRGLKGRQTLEIGGPSLFAGSLYTAIAGLELEERGVSNLFTNVVYPLHSLGEDGEIYVRDGDPFIGPFGWVLGHTIVRHGAHLHGVESEHFGVVFSSHNLEHFLDPLSALMEWHRVLQPGGSLLLILPFAPNTFDRGRPVATLQELMWLHSSFNRLMASSDEHGLEAAKEIALAEHAERFISGFPSWDQDREDPYKIQSSGRDTDARAKALRTKLFSRCAEVGARSIEAVSGLEDQLYIASKQRKCRFSRRGRGSGDDGGSSSVALNDAADHLSTDNAESPVSLEDPWLVNESEVHWHVFDFNLLVDLVDGCMGYELQWVDFQAPFHQVLLSQKAS